MMTSHITSGSARRCSASRIIDPAPDMALPLCVGLLGLPHTSFAIRRVLFILKRPEPDHPNRAGFRPPGGRIAESETR